MLCFRDLEIGTNQGSESETHSHRDIDRSLNLKERERDGYTVRCGGSRDGGAGGVQRGHGEYRRGGEADLGEAAVGGRFETLFLSGHVHLSHTSIRWPLFPLHGQQHLWQCVSLSLSL